MLETDLQLKKDTAKATSPETPEGKVYWDKLYKKAEELFGSENITIPTLTRPWIVPDEIIIRETQDSAYIYKATLKVMLEEDYLAKGLSSQTGTGHFPSELKQSSAKESVPPIKGTVPGAGLYSFKDPRLKQLNQYSTQLIRELIIPKLTQEVNSSKRYASLRQVYYSLILARWFKARFKARDGSLKQGSSREPSLSVRGLTSKSPWDKNTYFKEYQRSFKEGEYNLKEPAYTAYGQSIRSYLSGGEVFNLGQMPSLGSSPVIVPETKTRITVVPSSSSPMVSRPNYIDITVGVDNSEVEIRETKLENAALRAKSGSSPAEDKTDPFRELSLYIRGLAFNKIDENGRVTVRLSKGKEMKVPLEHFIIHEELPDRFGAISIKQTIELLQEKINELFATEPKTFEDIESVYWLNVGDVLVTYMSVYVCAGVAPSFSSETHYFWVIPFRLDEKMQLRRSSDMPVKISIDELERFRQSGMKKVIIPDSFKYPIATEQYQYGADSGISTREGSNQELLAQALSLQRLKNIARFGLLMPLQQAYLGIAFNGSADKDTITTLISVNTLINCVARNEETITDSLYNLARGSLTVSLERRSDTEAMLWWPRDRLARQLEERAEYSMMAVISSQGLSSDDQKEIEWLQNSAEIGLDGPIPVTAINALLVPQALKSMTESVFPGIPVIAVGNRERKIIFSKPVEEGSFRGRLIRAEVEISVPDFESVLTEKLNSLPLGEKLIIHGIRLVAPSDISSSPVAQDPRASSSLELPISRQNEISSNPERVITPGGIDFRSLPIVTQAVSNLSAMFRDSPALAGQSLLSVNLDEEWQQIERMTDAGITPSSERLKEYIQTSCAQDSIIQDRDKILLCISDILRLEEERCDHTDGTLRDILVVLESTVSAQELRKVFLGGSRRL